MTLEEKFTKLGVDHAPGQEIRQKGPDLLSQGESIPGVPVDFSHGDVDAFPPIPNSLEQFIEGVRVGGRQAYTEYRGSAAIRQDLAAKLSRFTGTSIASADNLILTPGTQGALFLALASIVTRGDKIAIIAPDYFANRKIPEFLEAEILPVTLHYLEQEQGAGLDLSQLEEAFRQGAKAFLFSNPNNPTGVIYSDQEVDAIARLANQYQVTVIADQLYSRQIFDDRAYSHLCRTSIDPERLITIIGPSKTESLSGYRLGVAFGPSRLIQRMEKLQAIVSLRASGYNQRVLRLWFDEPKGWMEQRIRDHQAIRDDLLEEFRRIDGVRVRATEAGSYLFPQLPNLTVSIEEFCRLLRVQAGVTVTPGTEFGKAYTNSIRLNFSQDHQAAIQAVRRIGQMVERFRKSE
ncbi:pyridoxal phosphate-dependent aminotransferase [Hominifimenecus sp. rT4P-3]|uniref:pyridoxal phosphate-dependent aminotransferase n=1 Tax=Hominifimenecus sp. rT4P-3 TaxID=3242979 RepID=UPI003DA5E348